MNIGDYLNKFLYNNFPDEMIGMKENEDSTDVAIRLLLELKQFRYYQKKGAK